MTRVRVPPVLRSATGGAKHVEVEASTVGGAIEALIAAHPGLEAQLRAPDGGVNPFVNLFLNGTDVRHLERLETTIGDRDELVVLPAMAGG